MRFDVVECGIRIRTLREDLHYTQTQFAEQLNISLDHLKSIERGRRACSLDLIAQIALTYDESLDFLILGKRSQIDIAKAKIVEAVAMAEQAKRML